MMKIQTVVSGVVALAAFGALAIIPVNADPKANAASLASVSVAPGASVNPPETPQELTSDMTYGRT